jgi:hypothetical protein
MCGRCRALSSPYRVGSPLNYTGDAEDSSCFPGCLAAFGVVYGGFGVDEYPLAIRREHGSKHKTNQDKHRRRHQRPNLRLSRHRRQQRLEGARHAQLPRVQSGSLRGPLDHHRHSHHILREGTRIHISIRDSAAVNRVKTCSRRSCWACVPPETGTFVTSVRRQKRARRGAKS